MAVVARVLLDHVQVDPPQRVVLAGAGFVETDARPRPRATGRRWPDSWPGRRRPARRRPRRRPRSSPARSPRSTGGPAGRRRRGTRPRPRTGAGPGRAARASTAAPTAAPVARASARRTSAAGSCAGTPGGLRARPARRSGCSAARRARAWSRSTIRRPYRSRNRTFGPGDLGHLRGCDAQGGGLPMSARRPVWRLECAAGGGARRAGARGSPRSGARKARRAGARLSQ